MDDNDRSGKMWESYTSNLRFRADPHQRPLAKLGVHRGYCSNIQCYNALIHSRVCEMKTMGNHVNQHFCL